MSLTFEAEVYRCQEILSGERAGCSRRISLGQHTMRAEPQIPAGSRFARQESLLSLACRTCARPTNDNRQARHTCTHAQVPFMDNSTFLFYRDKQQAIE